MALEEEVISHQYSEPLKLGTCADTRQSDYAVAGLTVQAATASEPRLLFEP